MGIPIFLLRAATKPANIARRHFNQVKVSNLILADHTGQPLKRIQDDTERDYIMGPDQGKEYGIIDDVIRKRA